MPHQAFQIFKTFERFFFNNDEHEGKVSNLQIKVKVLHFEWFSLHVSSYVDTEIPNGFKKY